MENLSDKIEQLRERLSPPRHTDTSTVLNGIGNGVMVGGLPAILYEQIQTANKKLLPRNFGAIAAFSTVACAAIGAWYGAKEAKQVREYRGRITEEILQLHIDNAAHKEAAAKWTQREAALAEASPQR